MTESCLYAPTGIRNVSSTTTVRKCRAVRTEVEAAFMQRGPSERDVYVITPHASRLRKFLSMLVVAAYVIVS